LRARLLTRRTSPTCGCAIGLARLTKSRGRRTATSREFGHVSTCVRGGQAAVGLQQSPLPRPCQERHAGVYRAGPGQHLLGQRTLDGTGPSMSTASRPEGLQTADRRPYSDPDCALEVPSRSVGPSRFQEIRATSAHP